jgi:hypothetical protein
VWILVGGLAMLGVLFATRSSIRDHDRVRMGEDPANVPGIMLSPVSFRDVCVTRGALLAHGIVDAPTFRAVLLKTSGAAVALAFVYRGRTRDVRALASRQVRRQIGLKLRAANGCNLIYVMWRLDPTPQLEVSIKINPGMHTHGECGADGYTKIRPAYYDAVGAPRVGVRHLMQAEIVGDQLLVWIDGPLAWRGTLPDEARALTGPSGIRSDNLAYDIAGLWASAGWTDDGMPRCLTDGED